MHLDAVARKARFIPSHEIYARIKWDHGLPDPSQWIIGYLDRFDGIMEIGMEEFDAVRDDTYEGVPQHRIRYFKCRGEVVWDRELRLDRLAELSDRFMAEEAANAVPSPAVPASASAAAAAAPFTPASTDMETVTTGMAAVSPFAAAAARHSGDDDEEEDEEEEEREVDDEREYGDEEEDDGQNWDDEL